jgi:hypothetical protein
VNGPVFAGRFPILAGAVEWIDDPDAAALEADRVVDALLREHGVIWSKLGETAKEELVGESVALSTTS